MKKSIQIILCVWFVFIAYSLYSADKPKTIDPLDHMAAISGLLTASIFVDKETREKYELCTSCLVSRLISEKDEDKFFFTVRDHDMLVSPQFMPKKLSFFNEALGKAHRSYKIAEFEVRRLDEKLVVVYQGCEYSSSVSRVVASLDPSQNMNVITSSKDDDVVCNYHITEETYHSSKSLGRSWYPHHQIVVRATYGTTRGGHRVSLYAIPHDNRYKDKDV